MNHLLTLGLLVFAGSALAEGRHDVVLQCQFDDLAVTLRQDGGEGLLWTDSKQFPDSVAASLSRKDGHILIAPIGVMDLDVTIEMDATDTVPAGTAAQYHLSGMGLPAETLHGTCEEPV